MISNLQLPIDLGADEYNAIVAEDFNAADISESSTIKLYIPALMPQIKYGDPTKTILPFKGPSIYGNSSSKPMITSSVLREQNYLECGMTADLSTENMKDTINMVKMHLQQWITIHGFAYASYDLTENKVSYNLKKGTVVRCAFLNGKVSKLCIDITNNDLNTEEPIISL